MLWIVLRLLSSLFVEEPKAAPVADRVKSMPRNFAAVRDRGRRAHRDDEAGLVAARKISRICCNRRLPHPGPADLGKWEALWKAFDCESDPTHPCCRHRACRRQRQNAKRSGQPIFPGADSAGQRRGGFDRPAGPIHDADAVGPGAGAAATLGDGYRFGGSPSPPWRRSVSCSS